MAIAIDSNPSSQFHIAYRPVVWTVSSNDATVVRCIADIYINDVYSVTIEKSPDIGETDVFSFDVQSILQDNLEAYEPEFVATDNKVYADTSSAVRYNIRFFEVLDNGTTFTTTWAESGAGTGYTDSTSVYNLAYSFNSTLRHEETQDLTDFQFNGTYAGLHRINKLTETYVGVSTPKGRKIKRGDFAVLSGWYDGSIKGTVSYYNSADSNIGSSTTSLVANSNKMYQYVIDTGDLGNNAITTMLMKLQDTGNNSKTDFVKYEIVDCDNDYVSLYWQNDLGGMDYYLFRDGQIKTTSGESETYTKPLLTTFNTYDFSTAILSKESSVSISTNSEVLNRTQADGLSGLISHAVRAWIFDGTSFIGVLIKDSSITTIDTNDGEYRLDIELEYSNKLITQKF